MREQFLASACQTQETCGVSPGILGLQAGEEVNEAQPTGLNSKASDDE